MRDTESDRERMGKEERWTESPVCGVTVFNLSCARTSRYCVVPCVGAWVAWLVDTCSEKDMDRSERKTRFLGT